MVALIGYPDNSRSSSDDQELTNVLGIAEDVDMDKGSPGHTMKPLHISLPLDIYLGIAEALLRQPLSSLATCSAMNRTSRAVHYATQPALYRAVFWNTSTSAEETMRGPDWCELISGTGWKYTRFLYLTIPGANPIALNRAVNEISMAGCAENIKAVIAGDTSLRNACDVRLPFDFLAIRVGNAYQPGTNDVMDLWDFAMRRGGRVILNLFLPGLATPLSLDDLAVSVQPFHRGTENGAVRIDCITLNLYHEEEEAEAFETWVEGIVTDALSIIGHSWDIWMQLPQDVLEGDTLSLDVIGLDVQMAKHCIRALAGAIVISPMFCIVNLHVILDVPSLDLSDLVAILRPLETTYTLGYAAFRSREPTSRLGTIRISLASGDMAITLSAKEDGESWRCKVALRDGQGSLIAAGDLESLMSGSGFNVRVVS